MENFQFISFIQNLRVSHFVAMTYMRLKNEYLLVSVLWLKSKREHYLRKF